MWPDVENAALSCMLSETRWLLAEIVCCVCAKADKRPDCVATVFGIRLDMNV